MKSFSESPFAAFKDTIDRIAEEAANLRPRATPVRTEVDALRLSLEPIIDGYRHSAIGITGVFATDQSQAIASLLAKSVVDREHLTTTIARITRHDVVSRERNADEANDWKRPLRPRSLNIWPSVREQPELRHAVDQLELLHWLRAESDFSLVTFDSLGDVITRLPLAKRLDGIVIVNSGRQFDLDLMTSAIGMLERKGIRVLGQVRNLKEHAPRDDDADR